MTKQNEIQERIFSFNGEQVMIDRDLAEMYGVETKVLNQAVKRNSERFPKKFRCQLYLLPYPVGTSNNALARCRYR